MMILYDAATNGQTNSSAFEFCFAMEALKDPEDPVGMIRIEADPIITEFYMMICLVLIERKTLRHRKSS